MKAFLPLPDDKGIYQHSLKGRPYGQCV